MATIRTLLGREIADSRGNPTVEVELHTASERGAASVPMGASVGAHEARTVPAKDAVSGINGELALALAGKELDQRQLDLLLCEQDGTPDKRRLGANALLAISIAFARSEALERGVELYQYLGSLAGRTAFTLPCPAFNILNGGKHADNGLSIQEFMILPIGIPTARKQLEAASLCMDQLRSLLLNNGMSAELGDEGGFAPRLSGSEEALSLLSQSVADAGFSADEIRLSIDVAASGLLREGVYEMDGKTMSSAELLSHYQRLTEQYRLFSIEDPFAEDDWSGFRAARERLPALIVGDDVTVTNADRIARAGRERAVNAAIIKPNQVGTVTEAIAALLAARTEGWKLFASHRSGETMDAFIADFAVGLSCDYLKAGAPTAPERMAKYNRLMEIETHLKTL